AGVGHAGGADVHLHLRRHVVADRVSCVGTRQPRDRGQPDRRLVRGGVRIVTVSEAETPVPTKRAALKIDNLEVAYLVRGIAREVLRGVSFEVAPGEAYGLVGESGCGKSTTAYAALRYLPANGRITGGHVYVDGVDVVRMSNKELRELRASRAS